MSYVRFGEEESDVYVYLDVGGYLRCCGCERGRSFRHNSTADMVQHLREHIALGDTVPPHVIPALEADQTEIDAFIAETRGAA